MAVVLGGCASNRVALGPLSADAIPGPITELAFVSTRSVETDRNANSYYADGRGAITWGRCLLQLGGMRRSRVNAEVVGVVQEPREAALAHMQPRDRLVVYVHGYNLDFEKGCRRAARLQENLGLQGRLLLFSWPADGSYLNYLHDVGDLEWSTSHLAVVLEDLVGYYGAQNIDLVGHSLGARGLADTLSRDLARMDSAERQPFASLTLIAPDIDRDLFERVLPTLGRMADLITVYVSTHDRALGFSRRANGYPRAGQASPGLSYPDVDLVDISATELRELSGHIYHLYNPAVIEDMRRVLGTAIQEQRFERVQTPTGFELVPVEVR